jgi:hypothetical protein
MTDVFISYKREDRERVGRLVRALEKNSLSVWWDSSLPGGEEWRANIERELDTARCVVVVWTNHSVAPDSRFVREEAARAQQRGVLVPVHLDRVTPPLFFGEDQSFDLTHWRSSSRDPALRDVVAAVRAKIEGRPVPPAKGPMRRLMRRATAMSGVTVLLALLAGVGMNAFGIQDRLCAFPIGTPALSDTCGRLGLGGRPTRAERLAWEQLPKNSCTALQRYVVEFPRGAFRAQADALLSTRRRQPGDSWVALPLPIEIFVDRDDRDAPLAPDRSAARKVALQRGQIEADRKCKGYEIVGQRELDPATFTVEEEDWKCSAYRAGHACAFQVTATCHVREREEIETCDGGPTNGQN